MAVTFLMCTLRDGLLYQGITPRLFERLRVGDRGGGG